MAFVVSGFNFSFPWKFLHNVFDQNTQVNFNFGYRYYTFYGVRVLLLFTLAGREFCSCLLLQAGGAWLIIGLLYLWFDFSIFIFHLKQIFNNKLGYKSIIFKTS
jgi:hypothetical protein